MTEIIPLNRGWEFTDSFSDDFLRGIGSFPMAELPHTCREVPYNCFDESLYQMDCGYRIRLSVPPQWAGKRVFLRIGAAGHSAQVYAGGRLLAEHACGYTAFRAELTEMLAPGKDTLIVVRVDSRETQNIPPFGHVIDYMTFGGLYREVSLEIRGPAFIEDVFAMPSVNVTRRTALLTAETAVSGSESGVSYHIRHRVFPFGEPGRVLAEKTAPYDADGTRVTLDCGSVSLWSPGCPSLYILQTTLYRDGTAVDELSVRIGFRRAEFRADGFWLNGEKLKIIGLNRHQSWPYIGYAAPRSLQRLDAEILKNELGVNAVRTSHYPQSQHFIDRCDELGLLVFTEIPGWQHIGDAAWKRQAVQNTREMVTQYRNHPSVILWGVRINESQDDDDLYTRTNAAARELDPTRQTGGVRYLKKSHLLEDVYTYNDFSHDGTNPGCERKKAVTSDMSKGYLITEYCGHMFPTKAFDSEDHRLEHALRHARVLDAAVAEEDIAGSFGWCMTDYNTHRDFGSGDRICYHGVTDMFRNKKLAADVYASQQDDFTVLSVSSSMDIGEHPTGNPGRIFLFTNADSVRFSRGGTLIREYTPENGAFPHLRHPPIELDDLIGTQLAAQEPFTPRQAKLVTELLNHSARFGSSHLPLPVLLKAGWLMLRYGMTFSDAYRLYGKYIGDWGGSARQYTFEAVKDGTVVKTVIKAPAGRTVLLASADHTDLHEGDTYDAALIRIRMTDEHGNILPFYSGAVHLHPEGPIKVIGPAEAVLRGGMGGTYVKTTGKTGSAALALAAGQGDPVYIRFTIS